MKITSKGQVTIPKEIRDLLKTDIITFDVVDGDVVVKPVRDVGGSLKEYAKNVRGDISFKKMRDMAWEEAVHEKVRRKSVRKST
jgi:AbrB family looped-hinge helix DNA binding protein